MSGIRVMDVTLRDGGCVNDFDFGQEYMNKILKAQEDARIDIIELGYLDDKDGSSYGRTKFLNEECISESFLKHKADGISYVAMMDYGKFNPDNLKPKSRNYIDGIRIAFHKKDYIDAIKVSNKILTKGYDLYIQPMITLRYSESELLGLIDLVNNQLQDAKAFYIVDSFGEMRKQDVIRLWDLVNQNLDETFEIGFHSHNNLQLSYSNTMEIINLAGSRNIILDSSIMGMGKGAGNLNTELLLEHLNINNGARYHIEPLLKVVDEVVDDLYDKWGWGYAPQYYLSAMNQCTPSYASYFYNKHTLTIEQINDLLGRIEETKKISFDKEYAEKLYKAYVE